MRLNLLRMVPGLLGMFAAVALLASFVKEPVVAVCSAFIARFGIAGVFAAVVTLDVIPFIGDSPALFIAWAGGLGFVPIWIAASVGATVAALVDWLFGRLFGHLPLAQRLLERTSVGPFLRKYGGRAVAVSAFVPSPYSLVTMGAGAAGVPLGHVLLGSLARSPRLAIYLALIAAGWTAG